MSAGDGLDTVLRLWLSRLGNGQCGATQAAEIGEILKHVKAPVTMTAQSRLIAAFDIVVSEMKCEERSLSLSLWKSITDAAEVMITLASDPKLWWWALRRANNAALHALAKAIDWVECLVLYSTRREFVDHINCDSDLRSYAMGLEHQFMEYLPSILRALQDAPSMSRAVCVLIHKHIGNRADQLRECLLDAQRSDIGHVTEQIRSWYRTFFECTCLTRHPMAVNALLYSLATLMPAQVVAVPSAAAECVQELCGCMVGILEDVLRAIQKNAYVYKCGEHSVARQLQALACVAWLSPSQLREQACRVLHALSMHIDNQTSIYIYASREMYSDLLDIARGASVYVGSETASGLNMAAQDLDAILRGLKRLGLSGGAHKNFAHVVKYCEDLVVHALGRNLGSASEQRDWTQRWQEVAASVVKLDPQWVPPQAAPQRGTVQIDLSKRSGQGVGLLSFLKLEPTEKRALTKPLGSEEEEYSGTTEEERIYKERYVKAISRPTGKDSDSVYKKETNWQQQLLEMRRERDKAVSAYKGGGGDDDDHGWSAWRDANHRVSSDELFSVGRAQGDALDEGYDGPSRKKTKPDPPAADPHDHKHTILFDIHALKPKAEASVPAPPKSAAAVMQDEISRLYAAAEQCAFSGAGPQHVYNHADVVAGLTQTSLTPIYADILSVDLKALLEEETAAAPNGKDAALPQVFTDEDKYVNAFQPLLVQEFRAALYSIVCAHHAGESGAASGIMGEGLGGDSKTRVVEVQMEDVRRHADSPRLSECSVKAARTRREGGDEIMKDDLVMMLPREARRVEGMSRKALCELPHCLAIASNISPRSQAHQTCTLVCMSDRIRDWPQRGYTYSCVLLCPLSTYLREWQALLSLKQLRSMPLGPYILSGSPVVDVQQFSDLCKSITAKSAAIEAGAKVSSDVARLQPLSAALERELSHFLTVQVSVALLKHTGIGKAVKAIARNKDGAFTAAIAALAQSLMGRWVGFVKEHEQAHIKARKGGNILKVPAIDHINADAGIPDALWSQLVQQFNESQLLAIHNVASLFAAAQPSIALVQGPPGTGKTSTILGMLSALLAPAGGRKRRVLICAPSNAAIDEVVLRVHTQGLVAAGPTRRFVEVVRLGESVSRGGGMKSAVAQLTLDERVERELAKEALSAQLRGDVQDLRDAEDRLHRLQAANAPDKPKRDCMDAIAKLKQRKYAAELALDKRRGELRREVLFAADVVCSTLSSSNKQHLLDLCIQGLALDTVVIDEAAQTTEVASLLPLRMGCRHLVLIGDPRQLPATVVSRAAQRAGLGRSLFERLESLGHEVVMLTIQYRMHPEIRQFPSDFFYEGLLQDSAGIQREVAGHADTANVTAPALRALHLPPVLFVHSSAPEQRSGTSFTNPAQADLCLRALRALLQRQVHRQLSIAIIAPYKAQMRLLQRRLQDERNDDVVEVNTIDGFQGRERDVIIFCTVRSAGAALPRGASAVQAIGFVGDERRLNVAITRARKLLLIVGNADTLSADEAWGQMISALKRRDRCVRELPAVLTTS